MEINMKGYDLESFKKKDIWTWDEIVSTIEELEGEIEDLKDEIRELKNPEGWEEDRYEDIRLGLI